jgi:uncharacterized membrane protein
MVAQLMNEKGSLNQSFSLKKERKKIEKIIIIKKRHQITALVVHGKCAGKVIGVHNEYTHPLIHWLSSF